MDPRVDPLHDRKEGDFVVIVFVWSFRNRKGSQPLSNKLVVLSNLVYIGFGSEGNFSLSWDNGWSVFASLFAGLGLAGSGFLEGVSGELLVLHNLRSYVIRRGDSGR